MFPENAGMKIKQEEIVVRAAMLKIYKKDSLGGGLGAA